MIGLFGDLAFGNVQVGSSATRILTIANGGNSVLTVTAVTFPAGFVGSYSGTIPPGGSQAVSVVFTPTAATSYSGTVTVVGDSTSGANTSPISGAGTVVATRIIALGGSLSFGSIQVNNAVSTTLSISNTGNSTLTVSSIVYPAGFSGAWSGTIPAGGVQPVTVTFAPTSAANYGGTVIVNANQTSGNNTIAAFGTGLAVTRIISVSGNLSFGTVGTSSSSSRTMTITNNGNSALSVSGISYPSGFSGQWNGTIPAGASQNVTVTFSPSSATNYFGTITVNANWTGGSPQISASGTGCVFCFE